MLPTSESSHGNLSSRWHLLLKTGAERFRTLSQVPFNAIGEGIIQDGCDTDVTQVLQELQGMVFDLQSIVKYDQQARHAQKWNARASTSTRTLSNERPDIPVPEPLAALQEVTSRLTEINTRLANLKSTSSAKTHRILLEEKGILLNEQKRRQAFIDALTSQSFDLVSIGTPNELVTVLQACLDSCRVPQDLLLYLRNMMIHAIILCIIEASLEDGRKARISRVVERILDMSAYAQSLAPHIDVIALCTLFEDVLSHRSVQRLPIAALLEGSVNARLQCRTNKSTKPQMPTNPVSEFRRVQINHWLLTQSWVSDGELMIDSYALQARDSTEVDEMPTAQAGTLSLDDVQGTTIMKNTVEALKIDCTEQSKDVHSASIRDTEESRSYTANEFDLEFPSVPSTVLPTSSIHEERNEEDEEMSEGEIQRLITMFGPSSHTDDDDSSNDGDEDDNTDDDEQPDYSELVDLSPAEQEEVMRALATAREHHCNAHKLADEDAEALMAEAREALQQFEMDSTQVEEADTNDTACQTESSIPDSLPTSVLRNTVDDQD